MKLFENSTAQKLQKNIKKQVVLLAIFCAVTIAICVVTICLVDTLGRVASQIVATVVSAVFLCYALVACKQIAHDKKVVALCEKLDRATQTCAFATITTIDDYTTTVEGLTFVAVGVTIEDKQKTLYLWQQCNFQVGQRVHLCYANNVITSLEVEN